MPEQPKDLALVPRDLEGVPDALARARGEYLVDLYEGWRGLLQARAAAAAARAREAGQVDVKAQTLLNSVESAREQTQPAAGPAEPGLARADPLADFVAGAHRELDAVRAALALRADEEERFFAQQIDAVKERLAQRADSLLAHHRPRIEVQVQPVGKDRSIVHLARPEAQDLVLFAYLLSARLFTRYDAFLDDSLDSMGMEPPRFFAEEGNANTRFERIEDEEAFAAEPGRVFLPVKGVIYFRVAGHDFPRFRLTNRGPVMEAEARDAAGAYEHLMPRPSAELLTGLLIKLKIDGRVDLVLKIG